jgi:hypothetical protein
MNKYINLTVFWLRKTSFRIMGIDICRCRTLFIPPKTLKFWLLIRVDQHRPANRWRLIRNRRNTSFFLIYGSIGFLRTVPCSPKTDLSHYCWTPRTNSRTTVQKRDWRAFRPCLWRKKNWSFEVSNIHNLLIGYECSIFCLTRSSKITQCVHQKNWGGHGRKIEVEKSNIHNLFLEPYIYRHITPIY